MFSKQCKHVPHNNARVKTTQLFFASNDALPTCFFNQSPVLFLRPRVAHTEWCRPVIYNSRPRSSDARLSYASKPVVVAVPTGPRYLQDLVAVEGRTLRRSPRMPALPLAPHWAPCSIVLPSLADCSPGLPGTRVGRRRVKVRACRSSLQSVKRSACSRCRSHAVLEETINKQERTRTMNKGTSTLLSTSNVVRTAVRPRAALPPFTVQSPMYHLTT